VEKSNLAHFPALACDKQSCHKLDHKLTLQAIHSQSEAELSRETDKPSLGPYLLSTLPGYVKPPTSEAKQPHEVDIILIL
jgi:hypothetical protein